MRVCTVTEDETGTVSERLAGATCRRKAECLYMRNGVSPRSCSAALSRLV